MEEEKQICPSTVRNVAHSYGFKAYRALAKPPLDANQVTIVSFLMRHTSDSSQRTPAQGMEAEGEQLASEHLTPALKYGEGGGVMFWGVYHGLE